jgi:hypothetical protein
MVVLRRSFLALLLAVTLLGSTALEASANLAARITATVEVCCDGDCPLDPVCVATCKVMQRCGSGMTAVMQAADPRLLDPPEVAILIPDDQSPPREIALHGLKRPPRI